MYDILTKREHNFMQKVIDSAKNSNDFKAKIAAAVVYKNKIISLECNEKKTHTFQHKFSKNEHAIYFHAETSAIHSALKILGAEKMKKAKLFVARVSPVKSKRDRLLGHTLAECRPCEGCSECISFYGIKKVFYTSNDSISAFSH